MSTRSALTHHRTVVSHSQRRSQPFLCLRLRCVVWQHWCCASGSKQARREGAQTAQRQLLLPHPKCVCVCVCVCACVLRGQSGGICKLVHMCVSMRSWMYVCVCVCVAWVLWTCEDGLARFIKSINTSTQGISHIVAALLACGPNCIKHKCTLAHTQTHTYSHTHTHAHTHKHKCTNTL
jgi:hypothetical protein